MQIKEAYLSLKVKVVLQKFPDFLICVFLGKHDQAGSLWRTQYPPWPTTLSFLGLSPQQLVRSLCGKDLRETKGFKSQEWLGGEGS